MDGSSPALREREVPQGRLRISLILPSPSRVSEAPPQPILQCHEAQAAPALSEACEVEQQRLELRTHQKQQNKHHSRKIKIN